MRQCRANIAIRLVACSIFGAALLADMVSAGAGSALDAQKPDPACTSYDLGIWAIVEQYESEQLQSSWILVDVATAMQDAKSICARGDVESAVTIYKSTLQQIVDHLGQLGIRPEE
jgi:hypothetical protein